MYYILFTNRGFHFLIYLCYSYMALTEKSACMQSSDGRVLGFHLCVLGLILYISMWNGYGCEDQQAGISQVTGAYKT